ncbi:MAG: AAA family ATPase [Bacteroidota bacterium]|nr:AAA family ATPase [Bacteroidota bacterium]
MKQQAKRIAIIGPESSGKSELCHNLAIHYHTEWIPEYARFYLLQLKTPYVLQDIINIYTQQFQQEVDRLKIADKFLFTDTEFLMAKVWCENAFHTSPPLIEAMILNHPYDFYLLTAPDLPWEFDPLRENPGKGEFFFNWYKRLLDEKKLDYGIVTGNGLHRTRNAISLLEKFLPLKKH